MSDEAMRKAIIDILAGPPYREFAFDERADKIMEAMRRAADPRAAPFKCDHDYVTAPRSSDRRYCDKCGEPEPRAGEREDPRAAAGDVQVMGDDHIVPGGQRHWKQRAERAESELAAVTRAKHSAVIQLSEARAALERAEASLSEMTRAKKSWQELYEAEHAAMKQAEARAAELETELTETQAEVVGFHGIFASVAAHLGCNARPTTTGNDHVIARAKFGSECISALWKIATSADPDAGLDPHGFANRVIYPQQAAEQPAPRGECETGEAITVWKNHTWKRWHRLDATYAENDQDWLMTIPLDEPAKGGGGGAPT